MNLKFMRRVSEQEQAFVIVKLVIVKLVIVKNKIMSAVCNVSIATLTMLSYDEMHDQKKDRLKKTDVNLLTRAQNLIVEYLHAGGC